MTRRAENLIGRLFGRLTVIELLPERRYSKRVWLCQCACGNEHRTTTQMLLSGKARSCGCIQREKAAEAIRSVQPKSKEAVAQKKFHRLCRRCRKPLLAKRGQRYHDDCRLADFAERRRNLRYDAAAVQAQRDLDSLQRRLTDDRPSNREPPRSGD